MEQKPEATGGKAANLAILDRRRPTAAWRNVKEKPVPGGRTENFAGPRTFETSFYWGRAGNTVLQKDSLRHRAEFSCYR